MNPGELRMRITLLTLDFPPATGGVQQYLYEVACRLGKHHDVIVVTPAGGPLPLDLSFHRLLLPTASLRLFVQTLRALRPDQVLVGHAHPRLLLPAALIAWGCYVTLTHGNDYLAAQKQWHRPLFNRLMGASRLLITSSQANAARLRNLGLPDPVVIWPGTDPTRFYPPASPPPPPLTLLTVGRIVPRKGVDTVLHTLPTLLQVFPDLRYRVVGDGPDRERLERLACDLGLAHAVEFLGHVPDKALPDIYRQAHVFTMPAREEAEATSMEGFGIVYLEASSSGLPVVAGLSGGVAEAVRNGETGLLVPPNDPEALAQALLRLFRDPELRQQMGTAGRRWVEEEMNWDRTAQQIREVLEKRE